MEVRSSRPEELLKSDRVVGRKEPSWFVTRILGEKPCEKQVEILNGVRDHELVAVRGCNGSGKTFLGALATLWWLLAYDDAVVITTAPSEIQVREIFWREIRSMYVKNRHLIGGKLSLTRLELSEKNYAFGFWTNRPDRFEGIHSENILAIVDEASGVKEQVLESILGCLTPGNSKMLMMGNPTSSNGMFYDAFHEKSARWHTIHISAFDLPAFDKVEPGALLLYSEESLTAMSTSADSASYPPGLAVPKWAQRIVRLYGIESSNYQIGVLGEFPGDGD